MRAVSREGLKKRQESITSIERLTSSLKLVSMVRFRKLQRRISRIGPYLEGMRDLGERILQRSLEERVSGEHLYVAITADEGLAGEYNSCILSQVQEIWEAASRREDRETSFLVLGRRGEEHFQRKKIPYLKSYPSSLEVVSQLCSQIYRDYQRRRLNEITLIYSPFKSFTRDHVVVDSILPLKDKKREERYLLEPTREEVVEVLLPHYLSASLESALLRAKLKEELLRMMTMDGAYERAKELLKQVSITWNKMRQREITQELLEIVSGSMEVNI